MALLVDTNILLRLRDERSPHHAACAAIFDRAPRHADWFICTQILIEYWAVATRPASANGLGLSVSVADSDLHDFATAFECLDEPANILQHWQELVRTHAVMGRQAHDARLVALMDARRLSHLLTINTADFRRYHHLRLTTPHELLATNI